MSRRRLCSVAGILLFVLATETDRFFSWTIEPPLTAAFLGAAYWAACVLLAWAARESTWERARAVLPPVFIIAVLLLVATRSGSTSSTWRASSAGSG